MFTSLTFVTTRPIMQACWLSLLPKFKVQSYTYLVNENFMLNPKSCVVVGYELLDSSGVFT